MRRTVALSSSADGEAITDIDDVLSYECLLSYRVNQDGTVDTSQPYADYVVRGVRGAKTHNLTVTVPPDSVVVVQLFPTGTISGTVSFSDVGSPSPTDRIGVHVPRTETGIR